MIKLATSTSNIKLKQSVQNSPSKISKKYTNQLSLGGTSKLKLKLVNKNSPKRNDNLEDSPSKILRITKSKIKKQRTMDANIKINFKGKVKNNNDTPNLNPPVNNDPLSVLLQTTTKESKQNSVFKSLEKVSLPKIENPPYLDIQNPLEYSFGEIPNINKTIKKVKTLQTGCLNFSQKNEGLLNNLNIQENNIISPTTKNFLKNELSIPPENPKVILKKKSTFGTETRQRHKKIIALKTPKNLNLYLQTGMSTTNQNLKDYKSKSSYKYANAITNSNSNSNSNPNIEIKINPAKISSHFISDQIRTYGVNSYKASHKEKNYNKVSIILSVQKPKNYKGDVQHWPVISYFAIFEGEKGSKCCDFLRDNLHHFIIGNEYFPKNPAMALSEGFLKAQEEYLNFIKNEPNNKSSSSALVALMINENLYLAIVGSGNSIISAFEGNKSYSLKNQKSNSKGNILCQSTKTNFNSNLSEKGRIFCLSYDKNESDSKGGETKFSNTVDFKKENLIPIIKTYNLKESPFDFLFLANSKMFEEITKEEIFEEVFKNLTDSQNKEMNIHSLCGETVNNIIKKAYKNGSKENMSCILLFFSPFMTKFDNLETFLKKYEKDSEKKISLKKDNLNTVEEYKKIKPEIRIKNLSIKV
ncbi:MAG: protein phosphatase 2C family protein [archaeon]|nr:protein phosphatase 2C family protein [archaeon]